MMQSILAKMLPMDFLVTREAAKFAAEASIHHLCTVANLIKTCCLEGAAHDLATSLGPERFTEWKAAPINQAARQVPNLFRGSSRKRYERELSNQIPIGEHWHIDSSHQGTTLSN
jgi:hypothetical protein